MNTAQFEKKWAKKLHLANQVPEVEVMSTGIASLDFATGIGGFPVGRQVEIFGRESVGKSALTYYIMSQAHKLGHYTGYLNLEGEFHPGWAKQICPDFRLNKCAIDNDVDPGSDAVKLLGEMVESGDFRIIVFDSLGAMLGDKEQDYKEKKQAGGQSGLIAHMVKLIRIPARENKCTVIYVNQIRDAFDSLYGVETTPGGHAPRHMAVIRIHLKPGESYFETIDGQRVRVGFRVNAKLIKNKVGIPNISAGWNFWNQPNDEGIMGVDLNQDLLDMSIAHGVIEQGGGGNYRHPLFPEEKIRGREHIAEYFKEHPEYRTQIHDELIEIAKEKRRQGLFEGIELNDDDN